MGEIEHAEAEEGAETSANRISGSTIGAAIEVHRSLGPGRLASAYRECLASELLTRGHHVDLQRTFPIVHKGTATRRRFRLHLVVDDRILVEIKAVTHLLPVHEAQIVSHLRLARLPFGLLINFHPTTLVAGLGRFRVSVPSTTKGE
jgi:GxxExxY protein